MGGVENSFNFLLPIFVLCLCFVGDESAFAQRPKIVSPDTPIQPQGTDHILLSSKMPDMSAEDIKELMHTGFVDLDTGKMNKKGYFTPEDDVPLVDWTVTNSTGDAFEYDPDTGKVEIQKDGLYMVYSQVLYAGMRGAQLVKLQHLMQDDEDASILVQCVATPLTFRRRRSTTVGTCHTSVVTPLSEGDNLWIQMGYAVSDVKLKKDSTFWGLVRLGNI